jgi:hypothetical protein
MVFEGESWSERDPLGKEKTRGSEEGIADENGTGLGGDKDGDKFWNGKTDSLKITCLAI